MCYANPSPQFQPAMRLIASITQANQAVVTTTFAHNYISGEIVRLRIPSTSGMQQINNQKGTITVTGSTTFSIDIDSSSFDAYVIPVPELNCGQVVPVGEVNELLRAATKDVLPSGNR